MTNQVAITMLKNLEQSLDDYCELNDEGKEAFHMAITALELFGNSEQLPSTHSKLEKNSTKLDKEIGECNDCIKHGGDWECDRVHCHKGDVPDTNVGDMISRQAAIDLVKDVCDAIMSCCGSHYDEETDDEVYDDIREIDAILKCNKEMRIALKNMPSAELERKKGKWIYGEHESAMCDGYRCDKCGFFVPWDYQHKFIDFIKDYNYCPSCGADMRSEAREYLEYGKLIANGIAQWLRGEQE